jgi:hypothetical protein
LYKWIAIPEMQRKSNIFLSKSVAKCNQIDLTGILENLNGKNMLEIG